MTSGMKAVPPAALGEAGSWKRSNQADSAEGEGEGVARSRSRRHRLFNARRSARDSKSFSIARRIAENPPSRSNRSMSSTQSPPARFSNTTARTIWMSSQPWLPATPTCRLIAAPAHWPSPDRDRPQDRPMTSARGATNCSRTGNRARPAPTSPHPVGDGFRVANQNYLLDYSRPTGNFNFLTPNPGWFRTYETGMSLS